MCLQLASLSALLQMLYQCICRSMDKFGSFPSLKPVGLPLHVVRRLVPAVLSWFTNSIYELSKLMVVRHGLWSSIFIGLFVFSFQMLAWPTMTSTARPINLGKIQEVMNMTSIWKLRRIQFSAMSAQDAPTRQSKRVPCERILKRNISIKTWNAPSVTYSSKPS